MSQTTDILDYIETHGSIDPIRAMTELNVMRLASRINDLKKAGFPVITEIKTNGRTRWAEYRLAKD